MLYPQQNLFRNKLDLSGIWDFQIDPDQMGEQKGWHNGLEDARPMAVPGSWNEQYEDIYNSRTCLVCQADLYPAGLAGTARVLARWIGLLFRHRLCQRHQDRLTRRWTLALRVRDHRSNPMGNGKRDRHQR